MNESVKRATVAEESAANAQSQLKEAQSQLEKMKSSEDELKQQVREVSDLRSQLESLGISSRLEELSNVIQSLLSEKASLESASRQLEKKLENEVLKTEELASDLRVARGQIELLQQGQATSDREKEALTFKVRDLEKSQSDAAKQTSEMKESLQKRLEEASTKVAARRAALEAERNSLTEALEDVNSQKISAENQVAELKASMEEQSLELDDPLQSLEEAITSSTSNLSTIRVKQHPIDLELQYQNDLGGVHHARYSGPLVPHGIGVMWFETGDMYIGEFKKGRMHGVGSFNHKLKGHQRHEILRGKFKHNEFVAPAKKTVSFNLQEHKEEAAQIVGPQDADSDMNVWEC